ncbi:MAG: hypothetical protein KJ956_02385, partial [Actinobacteria bacterium]|nr:hypothetical protein [Actinomycetota bacterium]
ISGIVLFITSFLPWYGFGPFSANGWDSGFWAWFGILLGIAAAVILALGIFGVTKVAFGPFKAEQIGFMLAILSVIFVVLRWITETSLVKFGLFLGIIAAAGLAYGGFTLMREAGLDMPDMDDFKSFGGGNQPPPPPPAE